MIEIENTHKNLSSKRNIKFLSNFIYNNIEILEIIGEISITFNSNSKKLYLKHTNLNDNDKREYKKLLYLNCEIYESIYNYKESDIREFIDNWMSLTNDDMGILLEDLSIMLGPFYLNKENEYGYVKSSKVLSIDGYENNLDIIFFDSLRSKVSMCKKKIYINTKSEFIECKRDIGNVIPRNINNIRRDHKKKLELMNKISNKYDDSYVYYLTFAPSVLAYNQYLKNNNYNGVYVHSILEIVK